MPQEPSPSAGRSENDDQDKITETAYLLRNAKGANRLVAAVERARRGEFDAHDLIQ